MAVISGNSGVILDCNEFFSREMGYDKRHVLGKNIRELFENSFVLEKISMNLNMHEHVVNDTVIGIHKDTSRFPLFLSSQTIYDNNQKPVMTVSIVKNIQNVSNYNSKKSNIKLDTRPINAFQLLQSSIYSIMIPKGIMIYMPKNNCIFHGDFELLKFVFVKIFLDSIKSMNKKGMLAIGLEVKNNTVIFEVEHSGNAKIMDEITGIESVLCAMDGKISIETKPSRISICIKK